MLSRGTWGSVVLAGFGVYSSIPLASSPFNLENLPKFVYVVNALGFSKKNRVLVRVDLSRAL